MWSAIEKQEKITGGYPGTRNNRKFQKKGNVSCFDSFYFFGVPGFPLCIIIYDKNLLSFLTAFSSLYLLYLISGAMNNVEVKQGQV